MLVMTQPTVSVTLRYKIERFHKLRFLGGLGGRTLHVKLLHIEEQFLLHINNRLQHALKHIPG